MVMRARLMVSGVVQGVNFRWFVQEAAKNLGINGWVKNLPDGDVEIECESETEKTYREFLSTLEAGEHPRFKSISVKKVQVVGFDREAEPRYSHFGIEY
jgi:acylphosphatase